MKVIQEVQVTKKGKSTHRESGYLKGKLTGSYFRKESMATSGLQHYQVQWICHLGNRLAS